MRTSHMLEQLMEPYVVYLGLAPSRAAYGLSFVTA